MKRTETLVWGPKRWIWCVRCEKSDVTSRHQLSGTYEMIRTAPKYYETHRNISLVSNGADQVHSLQKITT